MTLRDLPRFVLQRGPDEPVEPCPCGSPFGVLSVASGVPSLRCMACGAPLDVEMVRFYEIDPSKRRSPGHPPCLVWQRIVIPKVREEVDAAGALRLGAERWDLFCVGCGDKDGSVTKDTLRGVRTVRRRDKNDFQRVEVLVRAQQRCELCFKAGVPLDVGHCLSDTDAKSLGVPPAVSESLMNKCALCVECNGTARGYGGRSMHRSVYVTLSHTRDENRKMLDVGPEAADPLFREIFRLLRDARALRKEAA